MIERQQQLENQQQIERLKQIERDRQIEREQQIENQLYQQQLSSNNSCRPLRIPIINNSNVNNSNSSLPTIVTIGQAPVPT